MTAGMAVALPAERETVVRLLELLSKFAQTHAKDAFAGAALSTLARRALDQAKEGKDIEALLRHWEQHWPQLSVALVAESKGQPMPTGRVAVTESAMKTAIKLLDDDKPTEGF
jgi:hypothetical protein